MSDMDKFWADVHLVVEDTLTKLSQEIADTSREYSPVITGNLRDSISPGDISSNYFMIDITASYASNVIFGNDDTLTHVLELTGMVTYVAKSNRKANPFPQQAARNVLESELPETIFENALHARGL